MSETTSSITIAELVRIVAEEAGFCDYDDEGRAIVPVNDANDLQKCIEIVNRGIKMFISDAPRTGWQWTKRILSVNIVPSYTGTASAGSAISLTDSDIADTYDDDFFNGYTLKITSGTGKDETAVVTDFNGTTGVFTFTGGLSGGSTPDSTSSYRICRSTEVIDADSGRYLLNDYFGSVMGSPKFARQTNQGVTPAWVNEATIRGQRQNSVASGTPYMLATRSYGTRQTELLVWPYPNADIIVEFPYEILFNKNEIEAGVAESGSSTTLVHSRLARYADDYFNGWTLTVLSGTGVGETATITDFDQGTVTLTFAALSDGSTPDDTTVYLLEPVTKYHPAGVKFDEAIRYACLAQAEQDVDGVNAGYVEYYNSKALLQAYNLDSRLAARKLGSMNCGPIVIGRIRNIVTYNGE